MNGTPNMTRRLILAGAIALGIAGASVLIANVARAQSFQTTLTSYSVNLQSLPPAGMSVLTVIPANVNRVSATVQNQSGGPLLVAFDSGAPSIILNSGGAANTQGGSWASTTYKGRVRVYGPTGAAIYAVEEQ